MSCPHTHPAPKQPDGAYVAHADRLAWAEWEEESAIYNRASGETHILNAFPAELLRELCSGPGDPQTLARRLARECGVECTREWSEKTASALRTLYSLGLIDRQPSDRA